MHQQILNQCHKHNQNNKKKKKKKNRSKKCQPDEKKLDLKKRKNERFISFRWYEKNLLDIVSN